MKEKDLNQNEEEKISEEQKVGEDLKEEQKVGENSKEEQKVGEDLKEEEIADMNNPDMIEIAKLPTQKCENCGAEMPATIDTCINCGHFMGKKVKQYEPMDEGKVKKIRWIIGVICVVAFIIYMVLR